MIETERERERESLAAAALVCKGKAGVIYRGKGVEICFVGRLLHSTYLHHLLEKTMLLQQLLACRLVAVVQRALWRGVFRRV